MSSDPPIKQNPSLQTLALYASEERDCNYLPGRRSSSIFADPNTDMTPELYNYLADKGFRRSGDLVYTPHCPQCTDCISVRIPVNLFKPNRNQKRCWNKNQNLNIVTVTKQFKTEHFALFEKYVNHRHAAGGMDNPTTESYQNFLISEWCDTQIYEFYLKPEYLEPERLQQQLVAVAVVDKLNDGLSCVYTFFEPELPHLSLGRYCVLMMIEETKKLQLEHLYLGYWINNCKQMLYKEEFRPLQALIGNKWLTIPKGSSITN